LWTTKKRVLRNDLNFFKEKGIFGLRTQISLLFLFLNVPIDWMHSPTTSFKGRVDWQQAMQIRNHLPSQNNIPNNNGGVLNTYLFIIILFNIFEQNNYIEYINKKG
jgi:hypothetical protein